MDKMDKKYKLTTKTKLIDGHKVYRIKALKSFDTIIGRRVNKGDLGGWVESEDNLSHDGTCWLFDEAAGYDNSRRTEDSVGYGNSRQSGNSRQYGNSQQFDDSRQYGHSWQSGNSRQYGYSQQYGNSLQYGDSRQYENSQQYGSSQQYGNSQQYGFSRQYDNSHQYGNSRQSGYSQRSGNSAQYSDSQHITDCDDGTSCILCPDPIGNSRRTAAVQSDNTIVREMPPPPVITFPLLTDCDGNHKLVSSVKFAVGQYSLEITTDGAGAYLAVEIDGRAELNPDELTALAAWGECVCRAMDKHNGEGGAI